MKPFNLEAALNGAKVVTRDGREVTEIYLFKTTKSNFPLRAVIEGEAVCFTKEGNFDRFNLDSKHDLFMAPTKREGWLNIYPIESGEPDFIQAVVNTRVFSTEQIANERASKERIACVKIEWEE